MDQEGSVILKALIVLACVDEMTSLPSPSLVSCGKQETVRMLAGFHQSVTLGVVLVLGIPIDVSLL